MVSVRVPDYIWGLDNRDEILEVYHANSSLISTHQYVGRNAFQLYNFALENDSFVDREVLDNVVYQNMTFTFKVNAACGCIMQNTKTGQIKYYYASDGNSSFLSCPQAINRRSDWSEFIQCIESIDLVDAVSTQRPNTEWVVLWVTNLTLFIYQSRQRLLGAPTDNVPNFIKHNRGVYGLFKSK